VPPKDAEPRVRVRVARGFHLLDEQLDENGNGKVSYGEFKAWAHDKIADVAVDDINYTTRSHVDVGSIAKAAAAKIGP
jgi:hypothetical protein